MIATEDVARAAQRLRADRQRGAMQLATQAVAFAADLLADARDHDDIRAVIHALALARPSMAAIANAVALFAAPFLEGATGVGADNFGSEAARHLTRWQADEDALRLNAERHLPRTLLAYSNSSTTRAVLLASVGRIDRVIVPEGRPIDDGKQLATTLAAAGIPVTVITEAQMGAWVPEVGVVLVGADTVMPDGSLINHMGTATLAFLAEMHHIPVLSVAHSLKIAPFHRLEDTHEENDPAEIWRNPPPGVTVRNASFDRTSPERVTIITERGVLTDALRANIVAAHQAAWITCGLVE